MTDAWLLVLADMASRRDVGLERYGKPVAGSSEDWLQHAYEEALDLAVYLRAEIEKRKRRRGDPEGMGSRGGRARAAKMTAEERRECAKKAAQARWNRQREES